MPRLYVDLQEGFDDDTVTCRVEGRAVYDERHVTTRVQVGRADHFEVEVPAGTLELEIVLPRRNVNLRLETDPERAPWLGISLARDGSHLEHRISRAPFGYL